VINLWYEGVKLWIQSFLTYAVKGDEWSGLRLSSFSPNDSVPVTHK
jgi:hypothetical protein